MESVLRKEERWVGFVKEVGFKPGVKDLWMRRVLK